MSIQGESTFLGMDPFSGRIGAGKIFKQHDPYSGRMKSIYNSKFQFSQTSHFSDQMISNT